ncbi:MAG: hypothetical protein IMF16_01520 [Proteobacteria bacterium]|nr:hypothetical protein [Pseudomonadota bacterium]
MGTQAPHMERSGGVTWRAVLIAFGLLVLLAPVAFYVEIAWGKADFFVGIPAMAPVVVLFLLAGAMSLPLLGRVGLSRRELLVIYSILLVAGPVISHSILAWMLVKSISYYYMARANLIWQTTFLDQVPTWMAPVDRVAAEGFFQGNAAVPWALWWVPLAAWSAFMVCLFVAALCAIIIVQRQWIGSERLSFPLAQIPLEVVRDRESGKSGRSARLPIGAMFWIGLLISFAVSFVNGLSQRVPTVPAIPLGPVALMQWVRVGPLAGLGEIDLVLWPWMIAIAYLIPKELSFSAWFFWLVQVGLTVAAIAAGAAPQRPEEWFDSSFPAPRYQGGGAVLALGIWVLWIARPHIVRALRLAVSGRSGKVDAEEPLSYRLALIGLLISFAGIVYFGWVAGCRLIVSVILMGLIVGYYVMWARLRAETGLGFLPFPLEIQEAIVVPFGSAIFRRRELIAMISTRWAFFPGFGYSYEVVAGNALETFKIADAARINRRRLTAAIAAGFLIALVVGTFVILTGLYHFGFFGTKVGTSGWLGSQSINDGNRIVGPLTDPTKADANGIIAILAGGAVAVFLGTMRLRFWWWPFHPVGYMAAMCWGLHWYYMPFFIGWASKSLVIRYGGLRLYRNTVPLAIGLIVGDLLNGGAWAVVALFTGGRV